VLAATNRPDQLDLALLRPGRFDAQLYVPPPDLHGRLQALRVHCRALPLDGAVDLHAVAAATQRFTGAQMSCSALQCTCCVRLRLCVHWDCSCIAAHASRSVIGCKVLQARSCGTFATKARWWRAAKGLTGSLCASITSMRSSETCSQRCLRSSLPSTCSGGSASADDMAAPATSVLLGECLAHAARDHLQCRCWSMTRMRIVQLSTTCRRLQPDISTTRPCSHGACGPDPRIGTQ
jgi:hypothetical protein